MQAVGRRSNVKGEDGEFTACWKMIETALHDIHERNAGRLSFEQLYRASYKIVLHRRGADLYQRISDWERDRFTTQVIPPIRDLVTPSVISLARGDLPGTTGNEQREMGEKFLKGLRDSWERHDSAMKMVTDILMYLDRGQYQINNSSVPLYVTVLGYYRDNILYHSFGGSDDGPAEPLTKIINAVVIDLINMDRNGEIIDQNLIKQVLRMYETLAKTDQINDDDRLYTTVFEPEYLESSRKFFADKVGQFVDDGDVARWLHFADSCLRRETDRCQTTVSKQSEPLIISVVEDEVISKHLDKYLSQDADGVRGMLDNDLVDDLGILYKLVSRPGVRDGIEKLKAILSARILALGIEIEKGLADADLTTSASADKEKTEREMDSAEKAKQLTGPARQTAAALKWVDDVLMLKDKFDRFLSECFDDDKILESAVTKSFSEFINLFARSSEFVSLFIDDNLKNGIRGKTEAEVDLTMDKAITLIRYLLDKDMFQRYYQKHLARRLLHGKSESVEAEKQLISRMKQEIGSHFTAKFEGMFKDMDTSRDLTAGYREHMALVKDPDVKTIDLNVSVLTSNNWPGESMTAKSGNDAKLECTWPEELLKLQKSFLQFYLTERNGRVLSWKGILGTAEIRCTFPKIPGKESGPLSKERRYELTVSTHGMIILMLFNDLPSGSWLTYSDIQASTNIPSGELNRALASLSLAAKSRVLIKEPLEKSIKETDKFAFNASFTSKTVKIRAPIISAQSKVEDADERKQTEKTNDESRAHIVDAAVVRIMKYGKTFYFFFAIEKRYTNNMCFSFLQGPQDSSAQPTHHAGCHTADWPVQT